MNHSKTRLYETIFDLIGFKFWNDTMPEHIKKEFLEAFLFWKNPLMDRESIKSKSNLLSNFTFNEFNDDEQFEMRRFQKKFAHFRIFQKWLNEGMEEQ
mgnify:FL=1|jgi:hypothetical protein